MRYRANTAVLSLANPAAYLPDVATTLNNLGVLYSDTQRLEEAAASFQEALTIRRQLATANPAAYLPYMARTLNNLGVLYETMGQLDEAEKMHQEAQGIQKKS